MKNWPEKYRLKNYEFVDYKSGGASNRRARKRMRKTHKRGNRNRVQCEIQEILNDLRL